MTLTLGLNSRIRNLAELTVVGAWEAGVSVLRRGEPCAAAPLPPRIAPDERHLANIWLPGRVERLAPEHLFAISETTYPEAPKPSPTPAEQFVPRTVEKLRAGKPLRVLAWGDSVTDGSYLPDPTRERWQEQFVACLGERFPKANIQLNRWTERRVFYVLLGAARDWSDIRRIGRSWLEHGAACARPESIADLK